MVPSPPHIILIIADPQRYDTIRAPRRPYMETPTLDRLVQKRVTRGRPWKVRPGPAAASSTPNIAATASYRRPTT